MSYLLAIDPDTKKPGVALFENGVLESAEALTIDHALNILCAETALVIECPQTYGGRASRGDANDLIALARVVGRFEQRAHDVGASVRVVTPAQWKGQTPKNISSLRSWRVLSGAERERVSIPPLARRRLNAGEGVASGVASDVLDAVAIGLWAGAGR